MKQPCSNNPKYMYSGKESSPLGLGIAAEPLILGTIQEGRDKTNWIVALKNGVHVWSRITRMSEIEDKENEVPHKQDEEQEAPPVKKKPAASRKKPAKEAEPEEQKRPSTNYNIYMSYRLKQLANEDSSLKPKERVAHAVAEWKSMSAESKKEIVEIARVELQKM